MGKLILVRHKSRDEYVEEYILFGWMTLNEKEERTGESQRGSEKHHDNMRMKIC